MTNWIVQGSERGRGVSGWDSWRLISRVPPGSCRIGLQQVKILLRPLNWLSDSQSRVKPKSEPVYTPYINPSCVRWERMEASLVFKHVQVRKLGWGGYSGCRPLWIGRRRKWHICKYTKTKHAEVVWFVTSWVWCKTHKFSMKFLKDCRLKHLSLKCSNNKQNSVSKNRTQIPYECPAMTVKVSESQLSGQCPDELRLMQDRRENQLGDYRSLALGNFYPTWKVFHLDESKNQLSGGQIWSVEENKIVSPGSPWGPTLKIERL